jgi:cobalt-precorrin 5A hydrolase
MPSATALPVLYAGFGCRKGCSRQNLETLLRLGLAQLQLPLSAVHGIASIELKADEAGLADLARQLALPLRVFTPVQLQRFEAQLSHRSAAAFTHSGCWGVAESSALALAAQAHGAARLVLARQILGGATLAFASGR